MKKTILILLAITFFIACNSNTNKKAKEDKTIKTAVYKSFGERISADKALSAEQMHTKYKDLKVGDTITVKFNSTIKDVCSKKGCWMRLPVGENKETFVRFKDYGFFMPLDSKNKEVIVEGKAFVKETSVAELQHYAEDAGKSKEEIAKITAPKKEFAFLANGVLLK